MESACLLTTEGASRPRTVFEQCKHGHRLGPTRDAVTQIFGPLLHVSDYIMPLLTAAMNELYAASSSMPMRPRPPCPAMTAASLVRACGRAYKQQPAPRPGAGRPARAGPGRRADFGPAAKSASKSAALLGPAPDHDGLDLL